MTVIKLATTNDSPTRAPVHGCGTCRFVADRGWGTLQKCTATGQYCDVARNDECLNGKLWEPYPRGFWKRLGDAIIARLNTKET